MIEAKHADPIDIPAVESILLGMANWLNDMGQPLWRGEDIRPFQLSSPEHMHKQTE